MLAALAVELDGVARGLGLRGRGDVRRGEHAGTKVVAAASGIGLARARRRAEELLAAEPFAATLIVGIAGGLRESLAVGDVIVPAEVVQEEGGGVFSPTIASAAVRARLSGRLVSAARAATTAAGKAALRDRYRADAVDMESAAVAAVCDARGVPWLCVRAISDDAGTELPPEMLALAGADGRPRLGAAVSYALRNPFMIPRLIRLGRDTATAVDQLAARVRILLAELRG